MSGFCNFRVILLSNICECYKILTFGQCPWWKYDIILVCIYLTTNKLKYLLYIFDCLSQYICDSLSLFLTHFLVGVFFVVRLQNLFTFGSISHSVICCKYFFQFVSWLLTTSMISITIKKSLVFMKRISWFRGMFISHGI